MECDKYMTTAILVSEKQSIINEIKPVYEKIKNQLPYKIVGWQSLAGHILTYNKENNKKDWAWENLPWFPEEMKDYDFESMAPKDPKNYYVMIKGKSASERIGSIKKLLKEKKPDIVINAGDPDAEGSILVREVLSYVGVPLTQERRFWNNAMTDKEITRAFKNLLPVSHKFPDGSTIKQIYQAAQMRVIMDQVLGFSYTEAVSLKTRSLISLGRVQAPTLSIIAERELANKNFVPETYYMISEEFNAPEGKYSGTLINEKDKTELKIKDKAEADKIVKDLSSMAQITEINKHTTESSAPKVNSTVSMERKISKMGYNTKKQIDPALEHLYLPSGIMTYPRTDTQYMETDTADEIPDILEACRCVPQTASYVDKILADKSLMEKVGKDKNYFNTAKTSSHEALRLTGKKFDYDKLNDLEKAIVTELAVSFVKLFLPKKKIAVTDLITDNNKHLFKTHGSVVIDPGWTVLNSGNTKDVILPDVKDKENVNAMPAKVDEKQTTPPGFYSESDLLGVMNNVQTLLDDKDAKKRLKNGVKINGQEQYAQGIGTPSTRSTVIERLKASKLIELQGRGKNKRYHATNQGLKIYEALKTIDIFSPIFTAGMENRLSEVMLGKNTVENYNAYLQDYITKQMQIVHDNDKIPVFDSEKKKVHYEDHPTSFTWNGLPVVKVTGGEYGAFYSITDDKSGKRYIFSAAPGGHEFTDQEVECLLAGKKVNNLLLKTKSGNTNKFNVYLDPKTLKLQYERVGVKDTGIKYKGKPLMQYPPQPNKKTGKMMPPYYAVAVGKKWLSFFAVSFGHTWTNDEITELLSGKTVKDVEMEFKNGKTKVDAKMQLSGKQMGHIDLIFHQKEYGEKTGIVVKGIAVYQEESKAGKPYYKWNGHFIPYKFASHVYSDDEISDFLSGKNVTVEYTSSKGNDVTSTLHYNMKTDSVEFVDDKK